MQQENKKTGAAILAIALSVFGLGWIGGHKFYLGY